MPPYRICRRPEARAATTHSTPRRDPMRLAIAVPTLFGAFWLATGAAAAAPSSTDEPLDSFSRFEGKWDCQASHPALFTDAQSIATEPRGSDPNGHHGRLWVKRVLNKSWLVFLFRGHHGGGGGGGDQGGDDGGSGEDPNGDILLHHGPGAASLV